ncbi:MAG: GNAT family N-acetyltransferase [Gemmatimonadota bacterium]
MSRITIRAARPDDAAIFLELIDALADYEKLERPGADARQRLLRDGFGESRRFTAYLAELDRRVVGYAITFHTYSSFLARPTLFLEDLFVLPDARKNDVGTAFFRFLAAEALRQECGRMEWVVLDWNQLAIDFYDALGARQMSEWLPYRLNQEQLVRIAAGDPH